MNRILILLAFFVFVCSPAGCSNPDKEDPASNPAPANLTESTSEPQSMKETDVGSPGKDAIDLPKQANEMETSEIASIDESVSDPENAHDAHSNSAIDKELPSLADAERNPVDPDQDSFRSESEPIEEKQTINIPDSWKRLSKEQEIWIDMKNKQVIAAGNICLRAGPLEVFACPRRTKEHESVVSVNALSSQIHAALLATGTEPGEPVRWHERYQPATGPVIKIEVLWKSDGDIQRIPAQKMVKDFKSGKEMTHDWVFGGSQTYTDEETGETYYYGDSGELVCLSNFSTATMDVPVQSSDANDGLLFGANTPNIPEVNTKVYLIFTPQPNAKNQKKPEVKSEPKDK